MNFHRLVKEFSSIVGNTFLNAFYYTNLIRVFVVVSLENKLHFLFFQELLQTKYNDD